MKEIDKIWKFFEDGDGSETEDRKMFQVGDYVVKAANGICKVNDIVKLDFVADKKRRYYQLEPLWDSREKSYVPVDKEDNSMRRVMTRQEAIDLMEKIPLIDATWINNEKERERSYKDAIQSNEPERLVGIIKLIYHRKQDRMEQGKKTTVVDERYFDVAENLLYSELELVMGQSRDEIYNRIKENCK